MFIKALAIYLVVSALLAHNYTLAAVILGFVFFYIRKDTDKNRRTGTTGRNMAVQPVYFTMGQVGKSYGSYTAEFYRIVEALAIRNQFHEMEAVIIIRKLDQTYCSVSLQLDLGCGVIPKDVTFGREFFLSESLIRYKTNNATGYSTPALIQRMITGDMASSLPGLQIIPTESSVYERGDYSTRPMVVCRYSVKYTPEK